MALGGILQVRASAMASKRNSSIWQVKELSSKKAICQVTLGTHHIEEVAVRAANVLKALHVAGYSKEQLEYAKNSKESEGNVSARAGCCNNKGREQH